jgi:hypothetical protein
MDVCNTRESNIYPEEELLLMPGILTPGTNVDISIVWEERELQYALDVV